MVVANIYSKRLKQASGTVDLYQYDVVPEKLRVQLVHILRAGFGHGAAWDIVVDVLRDEYGRFSLVHDYVSSKKEELSSFILKCDTVEFIDLAELCCQCFDRICNQFGYSDRYQVDAESISEDCLSKTNIRFRESAFGFEYVSGVLIRKDAEFIHAEAVLPSLAALRLDSRYGGAEAEFIKAHSEYRRGDGASTLVECCKSFESIMKAICIKRSWVFDPNKDTATKLVAICFSNNLIPTYWQSHFGALRTILESALPTPRNRQGGHGAGTAPVQVPIELARYVLHMTAATLLFLAEAEKNLP